MVIVYTPKTDIFCNGTKTKQETRKLDPLFDFEGQKKRQANIMFGL